MYVITLWTSEPGNIDDFVMSFDTPKRVRAIDAFNDLTDLPPSMVHEIGMARAECGELWIAVEGPGVSYERCILSRA